ncbi:MAG: metallophosphoesterase family protein [Novosphingobium sp.]|nr:metallophosphoesterase family protein [Novosphingobium sp.]
MALEAVMDDIQRRGVDLIVNLGDICSGPLFPVETADLLLTLDLPTIRGNHERQLLEQEHAAMNASDRYAAERLRPDQMDWLASLPTTLLLRPEVLLVHGTPADDLEPLLQTVDEGGMRAATPAEVVSRIQGLAAGLILCGHTHVPAQMRVGGTLKLWP